ncbi:periodic tryptophan protein 2 homolog [Trichonephila inaurata madagascariensis]|uniref:Periodic tryptophan protein 2 homolog n=1 Tax=Trichonephila inaurata madagascariensis TaxID=2747483 RepID=A0A8X6XCM8_9ARAC|nr:periodic tryptophan protein 2 homolog [Trichonephila inaurata madagascariensis]
MKFSFKFSNLLGTVYNKGTLLFTSDGNILISPVGNRISLYDLRRNKSETLPIEGRYNFTTLALSPNGMLLIAVNERGEALLISVPHRIVIYRFNFGRPVTDVKFSPNGKYLAVNKENKLYVYQAPSCNAKRFNPFVLERVFSCSHDSTLCIDWTSDSRVLAVGGADMTTKIYALTPFENLSVYSLGGHTDSITGCFFEENSFNLYTVSKNGVLCAWECNIKLDDLIPKEKNIQEIDKNHKDEDDILPKEKEEIVIENPTDNRFFYRRIGRHFLRDAIKDNKDKDNKERFVFLSSAAFHRKTHILVAGFSNGSFLLYDMPACNQIHSLSLSNQMIASIAFNNTGDWIALGSEGIGQLVVWEWQSESFVMKQQGHFNNMNCLAYSPDGLYIASGGEDGKVKIWDTYSGFCFVTFTEHSSSITGVQFCQNGKAVVSASIDGTVRAFDLIRYRNFKTYTTPEPIQFSCVAVDRSSEIICAGSQDSFEIYVWYLKTAHLLSILAGHEAPISQISINPVDLYVASSSWDKTVRLWNISGSKSVRETIQLTADGLCVAYRPDGIELAVATLDGQILFFHPPTLEQTGSIEGRSDLYVGRRQTDMITPKKLLKSQGFTSLCYTGDGECILAAGKSKFVCIYNVPQKILLKKFEITANLSFDAVEDFINRRHMTEFGNKELIEERMDEELISIPVPGSKKIDKSSRSLRPEIAVAGIQFSPTGRAWAATTTEGLLVYSLDNTLVFDPFDLDINITTDSVRDTLKKGDFSQSILMALRLNLTEITQEVLESIGVDSIETLASYLPELYVEKLLRFVVDQLETTPHIEFYVKWVQCLLTSHGISLKRRLRANMGTLLNMQKCLSRRLEEIGKMCENSKSMLQYACALNNIKKHEIDSVEDSETVLISKDEMDVSSSESSESETDMQC